MHQNQQCFTSIGKTIKWWMKYQHQSSHLVFDFPVFHFFSLYDRDLRFTLSTSRAFSSSYRSFFSFWLKAITTKTKSYCYITKFSIPNIFQHYVAPTHTLDWCLCSLHWVQFNSKMRLNLKNSNLITVNNHKLRCLL